jgi:hypothetical protein
MDMVTPAKASWFRTWTPQPELTTEGDKPWARIHTSPSRIKRSTRSSASKEGLEKFKPEKELKIEKLEKSEHKDKHEPKELKEPFKEKFEHKEIKEGKPEKDKPEQKEKPDKFEQKEKREPKEFKEPFKEKFEQKEIKELEKQIPEKGGKEIAETTQPGGEIFQARVAAAGPEAVGGDAKQKEVEKLPERSKRSKRWSPKRKAKRSKRSNPKRKAKRSKRSNPKRSTSKRSSLKRSA